MKIAPKPLQRQFAKVGKVFPKPLQKVTRQLGGKSIGATNRNQLI